MLVKWRQSQKTIKKVILTPENPKEEAILRLLLENRINLAQHLLLATKEKSSTRIHDLDTEEVREGELWLSQTHV